MSSSQLGNAIETFGTANIIRDPVDGHTLSSSLTPLDMSTPESSPVSTNAPLAITNISLTEEDLVCPIKQPQPSRPTSKSTPTRPKMASRSAVIRATSAPTRNPSSSIPLPVKFTAKKASAQSVAKSTTSSKLSRPSTVVVRPQVTTTGTNSKHTLEVQFINKKKRLAQLKKDLLEKQKPVLDLYQNLVQIKKKLEELGKNVQLEEVKLMNYDGDAPKHPETDGGGESISPEIIIGMQTSIEEIPRTLMDICKNLLGRRNVIVELLESITKSEVDVSSLTEQIETLKQEGQQLQCHLDVVLSEHHNKIKEIVANWQTLLNDKNHVITNAKVGDLEDKLKSQEKLTEEARHQIAELQKKLDDKRNGHDRYVAELNNVIHGLKDHIQKMESELESERKAATDFKSRNASNAQTSKALRNKVAELENEKKNTEALNSELNKKLKLLQDSIKHKEAAWIKEKDELTRSLKHQENLLQKLTADKNTFETRCLVQITLRAFSEFLVPFPIY